MNRRIIGTIAAVAIVLAVPSVAQAKDPLTKREAIEHVNSAYGFGQWEAGTELAHKATARPLIAATAYAQSAQKIGRRAVIVRVLILASDGTASGFTLERELLVRRGSAMRVHLLI